MRVVSGSAKGRKLLAVPGDGTRPILDRVKTALFDILRPRITGAAVLDLFAGTGAIGIEALSQGAKSAVFIDLNKKAVETVKENIKLCEFSSQSEVRQADAFTYLRNTKKQFDLIFVAPPQYKNLWLEALQTIIERPELLSADGRIIVQIDPKEYEDVQASDFEVEERRQYGNTLILFFHKVTR